MLPVDEYKPGMRVLVLGVVSGFSECSFNDRWATFINLHSRRYALVKFDDWNGPKREDWVAAVGRDRLRLSLAQEIIHAASCEV